MIEWRMHEKWFGKIKKKIDIDHCSAIAIFLYGKHTVRNNTRWVLFKKIIIIHGEEGNSDRLTNPFPLEHLWCNSTKKSILHSFALGHKLKSLGCVNVDDHFSLPLNYILTSCFFVLFAFHIQSRRYTLIH